MIDSVFISLSLIEGAYQVLPSFFFEALQNGDTDAIMSVTL